MMRKSVPAADPDAYVRALDGWRRECVDVLRAAVRKEKALEERIRWGHLVYFANGPALLIRILDNTAFIHARTSYVKLDGTPGGGRYTDVWMRQSGRWLCVSAHVTRL